MSKSYFLNNEVGNKLLIKEVDHEIIIMSEIKTLVYFDLEATGLKNSGRPRITELSLFSLGLGRMKVLVLRFGPKMNTKVAFIHPPH